MTNGAGGYRPAVAVVGAGSWGTTLAHHLASRGLPVTLWAYEPEVAAAIRDTHVNQAFLPDVPLHPGLGATADLASAVRGAEWAVFVTPSHVARAIVRAAAPHLSPQARVVVASKGIETDTLTTMTEVFAQELPAFAADRISILSGPSFAREVAAGLPTAVTCACADERAAQRVQELFSTHAFRVYTSPDVRGVELGGALKNVIAIAAGIGDGLGLGNNARSALITRGLAEISRLGVALGARQATFSGLAGLGDLVLTCTGDLSRNRSLGIALGQGRKLEEILGGTRAVAEGVRTTAAALRLSQRRRVEMPITERTHAVLYEGVPPRAALQALMSRDLRGEEG